MQEEPQENSPRQPESPSEQVAPESANTPTLPNFQQALQGLLVDLTTDSPEAFKRLQTIGGMYVQLKSSASDELDQTLLESLGTLSDEQRENMDLWAGLGSNTAAGELYEHLLQLNGLDVEKKVQLGGIQRRRGCVAAEAKDHEAAKPHFEHAQQNLDAAIQEISTLSDKEMAPEERMALIRRIEYELSFVLTYKHPGIADHLRAVELGKVEYDRHEFANRINEDTTRATKYLADGYAGAKSSGNKRNELQSLNRLRAQQVGLGYIDLEEARKAFEMIIAESNTLIASTDEGRERQMCVFTMLNAKKRLLENGILEKNSEDAAELFESTKDDPLYLEWIGGEELEREWREAMESAIGRISGSPS